MGIHKLSFHSLIFQSLEVFMHSIKKLSRIPLVFQNNVCTAKIQYRKFEQNIPRKGISRLQSQFPHSCVCERLIYSHDRSAYSPTGECGPILGISRSQTHECRNWDLGRATPFLGIHKRDFRCSMRKNQHKCQTLLKDVSNITILFSGHS